MHAYNATKQRIYGLCLHSDITINTAIKDFMWTWWYPSVFLYPPWKMDITSTVRCIVKCNFWTKAWVNLKQVYIYTTWTVESGVQLETNNTCTCALKNFIMFFDQKASIPALFFQQYNQQCNMHTCSQFFLNRFQTKFSPYKHTLVIFSF